MDTVTLPIFSSGSTSQTFNLDILDDELTELPEIFQAILFDATVDLLGNSFAIDQQTRDRIIFLSIAEITIIDNDGK